MKEELVLSTLQKILTENESLFIDRCYGYNDNILTKLFIELYGSVPYIYNLERKIIWTKDADINEKGIKNYYKEPSDEEDWIDLSSAKLSVIHKDDHKIDRKRTCNEVIKTYPDCVIYPIDDSCLIFTDSFIVDFGGSILSKTAELEEKLKNCIVYKGSDKPTMEWVSVGSQGRINSFTLDVVKKGEIEGNYNDDLPDDKINSALNEESSSIIILHGPCGTGKTNYIRNLIDRNRNLKFYWLDSSMFNLINNAEFIDFLLNCKNGVFILEDCETLLTDRNSGNGLLSSLLNISDGILGDSMHLKFICTFNADIQNIDKALLRKGRLKVKYEFKDLTKDKVSALFEKLGYDKSLAKTMPLCDIYNFEEDNGGEKKSIRRVGFA